MTIKVGDKVEIIKEHSNYKGKVGIVVSYEAGKSASVFFNYTDFTFYIEDVKLVEIATYVPVPKFKIGDVVYDTEINIKYIILEERRDDLRYRCWAVNTDVFMFEKELTREVVTEETKDE